MDLRLLASYIAQDSPTRARAFVGRIRERCAFLARHPHMGRPRPEFGPLVRSIPVSPVVVFYRALDEGKVTEVLRIIDGRRDLGTVFYE